MKRNLNLNNCSRKLGLAEYVCKRTAIPASNKAVHIICHYATVQVKKKVKAQSLKSLENTWAMAN